MVDKKPKANVSDKKKKQVTELINLMEKNRTVMVASIGGIPARQFQKIKKAIRGKAQIKVLKKSLVNHALEKLPELEKLKEKVDKDFALLLSNEDPFVLAGELAKLKSFIKVKSGQVLENDIVIPVGTTDLMAGPAITEFSNAKIKVGIDQGKIAVKEAHTVHKGEKVSIEIAGILEKLEIKPIPVGVKPLIAYDSKDKKIYANIKIDKDEALAMITLAATQAKNLALFSNYVCKETISSLLSKANMQAQSLSSKLNAK
jgi:large subunit ribosomal protein L10